MTNVRKQQPTSGRANRDGPSRHAERGFSYMEMIVAMGIILIAAAVAFNVVVKFSSAMSTETTTLAMQQSAMFFELHYPSDNNDRTGARGSCRSAGNPFTWFTWTAAAGSEAAFTVKGGL